MWTWKILSPALESKLLISPRLAFTYYNNNGTDNVEGYTIRQIEDALNGQTTWAGWRNNIKSKFVNSSEGNLEALFNHWATF